MMFSRLGEEKLHFLGDRGNLPEESFVGVDGAGFTRGDFREFAVIKLWALIGFTEKDLPEIKK